LNKKSDFSVDTDPYLIGFLMTSTLFTKHTFQKYLAILFQDFHTIQDAF
jgi:hypothetical protein